MNGIVDKESRKPPFLAEYTHGGRRFSIEVGGDSWDEAEAHLQSIGANARIIGSDAVTGAIEPAIANPLAGLGGGRVQ